ncbi:UDP-glucuronosyl/UDP-glucosyltransferase [Cynara cardunculus var. scolymus]|uniref:Glycosyltransferase n=1 Tax=Cynara cardunculus var. scolymus TaxID=59895 RepID=A0A103Y4P6_CYNCS|nr:UDP-glucuronosyl/UDP-glucosyltransferase [Cynara cardunculus var. scolymus]
MSTATDLRHHQPPHIALFPSAGMGHLTPLLRLASMLASRNCRVTLITAQPPVSTAEASHITAFLAAYPAINRLDFQIVPYTPPNAAAAADPFALQFEAINRSVHLLTPTLSSTSPPISAIFSDIASAAGVCQVADDLRIPIYIVSTTSARFTALLPHIPSLIAPGSSITMAETSVRISGLTPFEISTLPPPFFIPNHVFTNTLVSNSLAMKKAKGILSNSFHAFEPETISAVNGGNFIPDFPPFLPIGPLEPHKLELGDRQPLPWLDQQPPESVVYVSFGSRTAMSRAQIRELRDGLELIGRNFLWVLKSRIVDKEDTEDIEELLGNSFVQRTKSKGMVVKGWVNQEEILSHPAIGCFVSHCGWNSVMEAAARGIPVVAWPQLGDQMVNAGVVETAGLGIWEKGWGWLGVKLVKGEEIAERG